MSPQERKAALVLRGVTAAQIARELGVARPSVSMVLGGIRRQTRIEDKIASVIGADPDEVFPYRKKAQLVG